MLVKPFSSQESSGKSWVFSMIAVENETREVFHLQTSNENHASMNWWKIKYKSKQIFHAREF